MPNRTGGRAKIASDTPANWGFAAAELSRQAFTNMPLGIIKKLLLDKGFGFIQPSPSGADVFFHCSTFSDGQFERLKEGQGVSYEIDATAADGDRGPKARSVALYDGPITFANTDDEFRPLRRHPSARRKKPGWRKSAE